MNFHHLLLVGAGGFFGSIARYLTSRLVDERFSASLPYGTFAVNILGSFVLGVIVGWIALKSGFGNVRLLLATGFCGGFTTFSAFAFENYGLVVQKAWGTLVLYVAMSLVLSVVAVAAGVWVGRSLD